jgi:RNA polymerase sigma factor (sigma-70 family)
MKSVVYKNLNSVRVRSLSIEDLIRIYHKYNTPDTLNLIIRKTEKLVYKIAQEFRNDKIDQKDIQQVAFTGLLMALNRFDAKNGNRFSTFAVYCIKGEILHFIRDSKLIKAPRWIWKLNKVFINFIRDFEFSKKRYPTVEEISNGINVSIKGINEFFKAREAAFYDYRRIEKIDSTNNDYTYDFDRSMIRSKEYRSFGLVMEDKILLWDAIDKLCGINKKIIVLSYFLGFSQKEIGKKIGISQKSVSRKLKESIRILKGYFAEN